MADGHGEPHAPRDAMNGPVASNLVLLGHLDACAPGTKVRFLGCVEEYVVQKATLRLKHDFPPSDAPTMANVNIEHVLEAIKRHQVDVGSWVNVIGYTERRQKRGVHVQAIAVWDAGNVNLEAYQKAVEKRKDVG